MSKEDVTTTNASEVKLYKTMRRLLKILPASVLTYSMSRIMLGKLRLKSGVEDTRHFMHLCREDIKRITKQDLLMMADCMEDFLHNYSFTPEPYVDKPKDVLILDSPTDKLTNPMQRAKMLQLCPGANEYHFKSGGHVTMVNCREEYMGVIKKFLAHWPQLHNYHGQEKMKVEG
jgi:hypothetical protein